MDQPVPPFHRRIGWGSDDWAVSKGLAHPAPPDGDPGHNHGSWRPVFCPGADGRGRDSQKSPGLSAWPAYRHRGGSLGGFGRPGDPNWPGRWESRKVFEVIPMGQPVVWVSGEVLSIVTPRVDRRLAFT